VRIIRKYVIAVNAARRTNRACLGDVKQRTKQRMKTAISYLNAVAQGIYNFDESVVVFESQTLDEKLLTLSRLGFMAQEAVANRSDFAKAISRAGLPPGFRPWAKPRVPDDFRRHDLTKSTNSDHVQALLNQYRFMMSLFGIADERRQKICGPHCSHWWHHLRS
jgi:hypothetical protein